MKKAMKGMIMAAGIAALWLTEAIRVFGVVMLPTAMVAGLLVTYFDWRAKLLRGIGGERNKYLNPA